MKMLLVKSSKTKTTSSTTPKNKPYSIQPSKILKKKSHFLFSSQPSQANTKSTMHRKQRNSIIPNNGNQLTDRNKYKKKIFNFLV